MAESVRDKARCHDVGLGPAMYLIAALKASLGVQHHVANCAELAVLDGMMLR